MEGLKKLSRDLETNIAAVKKICSGSADIVTVGVNAGNIRGAGLWCDGMLNMTLAFETFYRRIMAVRPGAYPDADALMRNLVEDDQLVIDCRLVDTYEELLYAVMTGAAAFIADGCAQAATVVLPGFSSRAVSESYTEENVRASREGFVEPIKVNMTLIRRRLKSPELVFETAFVGSVSHTMTAVVYLRDRVSRKLVDSVLRRLRAIDIEMVLESGFIEPFFDTGRHSLFSGTGHTERPDTLCGKLREGRIGILVDGTPFAIVLPYLFTENFQSFDDYTNRPYYASLIRILKYLSFYISIFLPGLYVAVSDYNPELLPAPLLFSIAQAQQNTPLPLMFEALFITVVYEIVREAGLRLPRPVGHAVGLVGALVVGDAAVSAGLIGAPMVMVVALTAISSFTIPALHEPITILRYIFILVGGLLGPVGLSIGLCVLLLDICSIDTYGIPYTAQVAPFSPTLFTDGFLRRGWRSQAGDPMRLSDLEGAHKEGGGDAE
ncbi:MAG: spore germination protein [Oscillospiraceae bacterium]|nr:spore germination protein [Oscillospiraceae bacterium]